MIAERCRAYAKALHYKELEFVTAPAACVEAIIAINNQLQLPEAGRLLRTKHSSAPSPFPSSPSSSLLLLLLLLLLLSASV